MVDIPSQGHTGGPYHTLVGKSPSRVDLPPSSAPQGCPWPPLTQLPSQYIPPNCPINCCLTTLGRADLFLPACFSGHHFTATAVPVLFTEPSAWCSCPRPRTCIWHSCTQQRPCTCHPRMQPHQPVVFTGVRRLQCMVSPASKDLT